MKVVKILLSFLLLTIVFACSDNNEVSSPEILVVDDSLSLSSNATPINEDLADRQLGIVHFPGIGKVALIPNLLIVDLIDDSGFDFFLKKYGAKVIQDSDVKLFPNKRLTKEGVEEIEPTEKIVEVNLAGGFEGEFESFAISNGISLPVYVSNQETADFLNLLSKIKTEDSKKIRGFRPAAYAIEPESNSLTKNLAFPDWATCSCLQRSQDDPSQFDSRFGATWNEEKREAPIYNPFLIPDEGKFCTYNAGPQSTLLLQGEDVLTVTFSTIYENRESFFTGPEGNIHIWAFSTKHLPLKLPGQLDNAIPKGGSDLILKGPCNKCEWLDPSPEQYVAYQNFILWPWERSDPPEETVVFLWEGDECKSFVLFTVCNPDDHVGFFILSKGVTLNKEGILIRDIDENRPGVWVHDMDSSRGFDLQVKTVDFCRNNAFTSEIEEICNGYDDTCDGSIDEGFPKGEPCDNGGVGQCRSEGVYICNTVTKQREGESAVICNSLPKKASPFEICDGVDNDCDGATDEDWIQKGLACGLGIGTCGVGALGCANGHISCDGEITPEAEICDGLDNDCDGVTDEGCACTAGSNRECSINLGPCSKGLQECDGGTWSTFCSGVVPQPEVCDGIDNNCNGAIDEGVLNRCGGCGPEPTEVCDGEDNDCDGQVDEGVTNLCGGCWVVGPEEWTSGEAACDGIDNDCDGAIDERDSPAVCGIGLCERTSLSVCEECVPGPPSGPKEDFDTECTNGIDDDCDGVTDGDDFDCWSMTGGGG